MILARATAGGAAAIFIRIIAGVISILTMAIAAFTFVVYSRIANDDAAPHWLSIMLLVVVFAVVLFVGLRGGFIVERFKTKAHEVSSHGIRIRELTASDVRRYDKRAPTILLRTFGDDIEITKYAFLLDPWMTYYPLSKLLLGAFRGSAHSLL
jgi:amino acid transporter